MFVVTVLLTRAGQLLRITRGVVILGLLCVSPMVNCAVFGVDQRISYSQTSAVEKSLVMDAMGTIVCMDGTAASGFVVDISEYLASEADFRLVATSARALIVPETGEDRGQCAFVPAVAPRVHLKIESYLVGSSVLEAADSNDWAFAKIPLGPGEIGAINIVFEDAYDFDRTQSSTVWNAGFDAARQSIMLVRECKVDDKSHFPPLQKGQGDLAAMVIHDCDAMSGALGGPLLVSKFGGMKAIAINSGGSRDKSGHYYGVPYDPRRGFYNYSRRLDSELENKLIAFLSRFAHLEHPTETIEARSELVSKIQSNLTRLGFDAGPTDGLMGVKTRDAVWAFQVTLGITPTGKISEELLLLLEAR